MKIALISAQAIAENKSNLSAREYIFDETLYEKEKQRLEFSIHRAQTALARLEKRRAETLAQIEKQLGVRLEVPAQD